MQRLRYATALANLAKARRNPRGKSSTDPRGNPITAEQVRKGFVDLEHAMFEHRARMEARRLARTEDWNAFLHTVAS